MSPEEAYRFIDSDRSKATIYGVLRHVGLTPRDNDFEDCVQEAWLSFYLWLQEELAAELDDNARRKIAYTRMYRHILNIRYRSKRQKFHHVATEDNVLSNFELITEDDTDLDLYGVPLTNRQRELMWYLIASSGNQTWVAQQMRLSRRTISREIKELRKLLDAYNIRQVFGQDSIKNL